jgi:hypothetical protein
MKYKELVQFDPIESVIQINDIHESTVAYNLVNTYVVSNEMAEHIINILIPQLQFNNPDDNKGILIVGNYGTGKSHLMSVISCIASNACFLENLNHKTLKAESIKIAGKFKVICTEIGYSTMSLRDILTAKLQFHLKKMGVDFSFPDEDKIISHKQAFQDMMEKFSKIYPEHGLMLVVDELLDYLKTRKNQELILDLNFMREIGEICKNLRFRFIAGLQETIFDNEKFSLAAQSIYRIKDRFEQIQIARNDIKFVVSQRLLKKTNDQQKKIEKYLKPFAKYYDSLNERMEEFVQLFPIHPYYIDIFEKISVIEKREILKTLSIEIKQILNKNIPENEPGLVAFDNYWKTIKQNPYLKSIPEIKKIIDASQILESKIENKIRSQYKPTALRIIHALSFHRLTTKDIYAPSGISSKQLRDSLCLFDPLIAEFESSEPDKDLETLVETILREINKTVSGQFISFNPNNSEFYLDLEKTNDFDALIEKKADTLDPAELDNYYFESLKNLMQCANSTLVKGYKIWYHELVWPHRKAVRTGYLFFGTPNEKPTSLPKRDFCIYFIQPNNPLPFKNEKFKNEVFFTLKPINKSNAKFQKLLKSYSAAIELSKSSCAHAKLAYESCAASFLKELIQWLEKHIKNAFELTYQGEKKSISAWINKINTKDLHLIMDNENQSFHYSINKIAGLCFASFFEQQTPNHPYFKKIIKENIRKQAAQEAIAFICGQEQTSLSKTVLEALELLHEETINPYKSRYASFILDLLKEKNGQVINRNEIIENFFGYEYMDPYNSRLEPEWVVVLIAALVLSGDTIFCIFDKRFDSSCLNELASANINQLIEFNHLEQPKEWDLNSIKALIELVGMNQQTIKLLIKNNDESFTELHNRADIILKKIIMAQQIQDNGLFFWGISLIDKTKLSNQRLNLNKTKNFFDSIQAYTNSYTLKNFRYNADEIKSYKETLNLLDNLNFLDKFIKVHKFEILWLSTAQGVLPPSHKWTKQIKKTRSNILEIVENSNPEELENQSKNIKLKLKQLKNEYIDHYMELHSKARLSINDNKLKNNLLKNKRFKKILKLSQIDLLPKNQLIDFKKSINSLKTCFKLTKQNLESVPVCPFCQFHPISENIISKADKIKQLDFEQDQILKKWTLFLLNILKNPTTLSKMNKLILKKEQKIVMEFIESEKLPDDIDDEFIEIINKIFKDLQKIIIKKTDFLAKISDIGPVSSDEFKQAVCEYVDYMTKNKNPDKIKIVLE